MDQRSLACALALTAAACSTVSPVTDEQRSELADEGFDACSLKSPEETWAYWDAVLSDGDKSTIAETPYGGLIGFHMGWGMGIRNGLCLWKGGPLQEWFNARGVSHPDAMSGDLIALYWAHLNGCRPDADAFVSGAVSDLHCPMDVDAPGAGADLGVSSEMIDYIEQRVLMPRGAQSLDRYDRYYAYAQAGFSGEDERGEVRDILIGVYVLRSAVVARTARAEASPAPSMPNVYITTAEKLPRVADGGCSVVTIFVDVETAHWRMRLASERADEALAGVCNSFA